jgi:ribonuclease P protein component
MATQTEIRQLFNKARRVLKHPGLDLLIAPTLELKGKLIVVTPGRIGNAVERNTVRRRIKAIFDQEQLRSKGYDAIVFVKKDGVKLTYEQLKQLILSSLQQKIN